MAAEGNGFYLLNICLNYICLHVCMTIFDELLFLFKVMKESNMRSPEPRKSTKIYHSMNQSHVFFFSF